MATQILRHACRRRFLKRSAAGIVSASTLALLGAGIARAQRRAGSYGPLRPVADQNREEILALPQGFRYVTFGRTGQPMMDGSGPVPAFHDGMACFTGPRGTWRLIRNHENRSAPGVRPGAVPHAGTAYDTRAGGGTVTTDFDPQSMREVHEFVSLCGTHTNCAGGLAFRNAGWLSCEETTFDARNGYEQPHGYVFFVPAQGFLAAPPFPLKAMGRFVHEAAVADARTGVVYLTEDAGNSSGFYRFLPADAQHLARGGRLQMLRVTGSPAFTGWLGQTAGKPLACEWADIDDPDPQLALGRPGCFAQGRARGGAAFNRLEGIHRGDADSVLFVSTSGGEARRGQLWQYRPIDRERGTLRLVFESPSSAALDSPDNFCVTPAGAVLFCEDDASADDDTHPLAPGLRNVNRLVGLAPGGAPFEFALNMFNGSEFAGACFSPDGRILFVNIFGDATPGSGMTCAITGPWQAGPL